MNLPVLRKDTVVGKIAEADMEEFNKIISKEDNVADFFSRADKEFGQKIQAGKDIKTAVDIEMKKFKNGEKNLRILFARYMGENGLKKVEGKSIKSISYQEPKEGKKEVPVKQIRKGRGYVDIATLSKDDLVEMLEAKGVKTKTIVKVEKVSQNEGIRVVR